MAIDARNKNTKWKDAANLEIQKIFEYKPFIDSGHRTIATAPAGYKKIRVNFVFDINPADILSKHRGNSQIWSQLKTLLFWYGETNDSDNHCD